MFVLRLDILRRVAWASGIRALLEECEAWYRHHTSASLSPLRDVASAMSMFARMT